MKKNIDVLKFKIAEGVEVYNEKEITRVVYKNGAWPEVEFYIGEALKGLNCFSFDVKVVGANNVSLILHSSSDRAIIDVAQLNNHREVVQNEWIAVKWFFRDNPGWITPPSLKPFNFDDASSIGFCQNGELIKGDCYIEIKNLVFSNEASENIEVIKKKEETEKFVSNHKRGSIKDKKLLLWAWDEKQKSCSVFGVANRLDVYEKYLDFDGLVLEVDDNQFRDTIFTPAELNYEIFDKAIEVYKKTDWKNFKYNFFKIDIVGMARFKNLDGSCKRLDWFDDDLFYNKIYPKITYICKGLKEIGVDICLDNESYSTRPYDYHEIYKDNGKSFDEYQDIVRKRGREIAELIDENYPGVTVMMTYGPWTLNINREEDIYGLLPALYDGFCSAETSVKFIDGFERGYGFSNYESVVKGLFECKNCYKQSKYPDRYKEKIGCAFGIWIRPEIFKKHEFLDMLNASLCETEEYVWVYTENAPVDRADVLNYLSGKIKK